MQRLRYYLTLLRCLPKSLYLNTYYFGLRGFKLPILVHWRTRLKVVKGRVHITRPFKRGMISFGFTDVSVYTGYEPGSWSVMGDVEFAGTANFGVGSKIFVSKNGRAVFGQNFNCTAGLELACAKSIAFGENTLLSWNVLIMDTDAHPIRNKEMKVLNENKEIVIGNNVWIGARCILLKGSSLADNTIVGTNSLINKRFPEANVVLAGNPATIVKKDIVWLKEKFE